MSDLRTAALRALDALEHAGQTGDWILAGPAITALKGALAEPQEPVAWWKRHRDGSVELNDARTFIAEDAIATGRRPLIFGDTSPPQRPAPIIQPEIKDDKPFGYFRAEPFGWTDCAPTDEGAIPLYERPQQPPTPPEAQTEAEKVAYCAGWWAAMDAKREQIDKPQGNLLPWKGLTEEEHTYYKACGFVGVKAVEEKLRARNSTLACHQGEEQQ